MTDSSNNIPPLTPIGNPIEIFKKLCKIHNVNSFKFRVKIPVSLCFYGETICILHSRTGYIERITFPFGKVKILKIFKIFEQVILTNRGFPKKPIDLSHGFHNVNNAYTSIVVRKSGSGTGLNTSIISLDQCFNETNEGSDGLVIQEYIPPFKSYAIYSIITGQPPSINAHSSHFATFTFDLDSVNMLVKPPSIKLSGEKTIINPHNFVNRDQYNASGGEWTKMLKKSFVEIQRIYRAIYKVPGLHSVSGILIYDCRLNEYIFGSIKSAYIHPKLKINELYNTNNSGKRNTVVTDKKRTCALCLQSKEVSTSTFFTVSLRKVRDVSLFLSRFGICQHSHVLYATLHPRLIQFPTVCCGKCFQIIAAVNECNDVLNEFHCKHLNIGKDRLNRITVANYGRSSFEVTGSVNSGKFSTIFNPKETNLSNYCPSSGLWQYRVIFYLDAFTGLSNIITDFNCQKKEKFIKIKLYLFDGPDKTFIQSFTVDGGSGIIDEFCIYYFWSSVNIDGCLDLPISIVIYSDDGTTSEQYLSYTSICDFKVNQIFITFGQTKEESKQFETTNSSSSDITSPLLYETIENKPATDSAITYLQMPVGVISDGLKKNSVYDFVKLQRLETRDIFIPSGNVIYTDELSLPLAFEKCRLTSHSKMINSGIANDLKYSKSLRKPSLYMGGNSRRPSTVPSKETIKPNNILRPFTAPNSTDELNFVKMLDSSILRVKEWKIPHLQKTSAKWDSSVQQRPTSAATSIGGMSSTKSSILDSSVQITRKKRNRALMSAYFGSPIRIR